jgi:Ca2+-binding EF-hand superfamily protein
MSKLDDDLTSNNKAHITTNNIKSKSNESKSINTNSALIYNENKWTKLLTKYFETINTIDNSLEQIRSKLNAQNNFSSLNLFNYLDKNSKQFLTLNDFMTYLKENNIIFSEKNLRKLIHNFDKDNDFSLNYKEFLGIITPKKKDLKNIDTLPQDKVDSIPENNSISNEIKKIFGELISEELNLVEKCHELSQNIRNSKEFTTYEAFKEIVGEEKYINAENLKIYLKNKNIEITDVEINQLMFRIDSDNDGMISYEEFKNIFLPLNDIEYNQNENGKEKDIKNNTILNNINKNNYNINERNNYIIDLPLKLSNKNINKNIYNSINNNENKENNKNEINIKRNFNFDNNLNNKEKAMDYRNNDENEDYLNISH